MTAGAINVLAVALGGAAGCVCRWSVSLLPMFAGRAPWLPTLTVNVAGCLVIGIVAALFAHYSVADTWYRLAVTGFLGGFTTYSAFALESVKLMRDGSTESMLCYVGLTVALGFLACMVGFVGIIRMLEPVSR